MAVLMDLFQDFPHLPGVFLPFSPHLGLKASSNGFGHLPTDLGTPDAVADTHRRRSDPVGQWQRGKGGADGLVL